ncbi:MAG: alpha/beta fold hydrolase BchO [Shimia sp.]
MTAIRQIETPHCRWNVAERGEGPTILALHGTGSSWRSWEGLMATRADLRWIAPDLPGHAGTTALKGKPASLTAMTEEVRALLDHLPPTTRIIGHSAGTAIALLLAALHPARITEVIGINASLEDFRGVQGQLYGPAARAFAALCGPVSALTASLASRGMVGRILAGTGSKITPEMTAHYTELLSSPTHIAGGVKMMADWSLAPLTARRHAITQPVHLIVGENDRTVPPAVSARAVEAMPNARLTRLPGLGHLAHEEAPEAIAPLT